MNKETETPFDLDKSNEPSCVTIIIGIIALLAVCIYFAWITTSAIDLDTRLDAIEKRIGITEE